MKIAYFAHSLESCWNHGNAHFLRGVLRDLARRGHEIAAWEQAGGWSRSNLLADHGPAGLEPFRRAYPDLTARMYAGAAEVEAACDGADLVIVHEWNEPALVTALGRARRSSRFTLLFHDTHHRAVSDPDALARFDLSDYDGVLAFGQTLADMYRRLGWGRRAFVWHEAADVSLFHPPAPPVPRAGLVWIGNWGDGERTRELRDFLFAPAQETGWKLDVFGVRYPDEARRMLHQHGAQYHGWLANTVVPAAFARHLATVHVPRRYYASMLPGIPTIRMFEALACGIPLISAPWQDTENLFRTNEDFLLARDASDMRRLLVALRADPALRESLAASGLATIRARHSCAHRADELLGIVAALRGHDVTSRLTETA